MDNFEDVIMLADRFSSLLGHSHEEILSIIRDLGDDWKRQIILNIYDIERSFVYADFISDAMSAKEFEIALLVYIVGVLEERGFLGIETHSNKNSFVYRMD